MNPATGCAEPERPSLLAVDDEEVIRALLGLHLGPRYACVTAASAEEALDKLHGRRFDIVLTDLALPGRSGLEICKFVRSRYPETITMLMTGYGAEHATEALAAGVFAFVTKPFDLTRLDAMVVDGLRHRALASSARSARASMPAYA